MNDPPPPPTLPGCTLDAGNTTIRTRTRLCPPEGCAKVDADVVVESEKTFGWCAGVAAYDVDDPSSPW